MTQLLTAQQLVDDFGLPSVRTVRTLRNQGLPAVRLGQAYLFDRDDVVEFIKQRKVVQCPAETEAPISNSSSSAGAIISSGQKAAAPDSAARARRIAEQLKKPSRNSSSTESRGSETGQLIHGNFPSRKS